jgi:DNA-binding transcriptional MerR regulator
MLTIREVSRRFKITPHTLRFWEKELSGVLSPVRTPGGQRRYTKDDLSIISKIKQLKKEGLSLAKIKKRLEEEKVDTEDQLSSLNIDNIANEVAEMVRSTIYSILKDKS